MFSPLSVTREREKTDEGEAQTETEAPERSQSRIASLLDITEDREEGEGQSQPEEPRETEEGDPRRKLRRGPRV